MNVGFVVANLMFATVRVALATRRFGLFMMRTTEVAEECQKPQAEHVERRQPGGEQPDDPESPAATRTRERPPEDLILAEEAAEAGSACNCERREGHSPEGPRNFLSQAAHTAHVLFTTERVNDGARGQEQQ